MDKALHEYTDAEIAREHHWRLMRRLGDQTKGVHVPVSVSTPGRGYYEEDAPGYDEAS